MSDTVPLKLKLHPKAKQLLNSVRRSPDQRILNVCGTCTECCRVLAVEEIQKPENTTCKHDCNGGCKIYKTRPGSCKGYTCVYHTWMTEGEPVPLSLRPDRSKVIIDYMPHLKMHFVRVDTLTQKAWQKPPVINIITSMLMQPNVEMILMVDGEPRGKFRADTFKGMIRPNSVEVDTSEKIQKQLTHLKGLKITLGDHQKPS